MHKPLLANRLSRWLAVAAFGLLAAPAAQAQLAGTKAIPGDYATVAAAITDLNAQGVGAGGVTFNIAAGYTETFASPTAGAITATGTSANPIVFQKAGTGANPKITAGVGTGTSLDAIISLAGSDYVTFDGLELAENAANTTATTQMEFGFALFRPSATDGCQFNNIRNCVVTLNKTNTGTFGIYGAASTAATATSVAATSPAGANSNNKVNGNIITNTATGVYFTASTSTSLANYDQNNEVGVTAANQVYNFGTTATGWGIGGNYQNGFKVVNNVINNTLNYANGSTSAVAASTVTSTLRGIFGNSGPSASIDIVGNTVTLASGATTSLMTGIDNGIGGTAASNTVNITGNTVLLTYATATSASITGIVNSASAATVNVTGNTVQNATAAAATTATFTAISNSASAGVVNLNNNIVTNNVVPGTGTMLLITGGSPTTLNMNGNTLTGNSKTPSAPSSSITLQCLTASSAAVTANNNTVNNNTIVISGTSSSSGTVYGYTNGGSPTSETLTSNTFTNLGVSGTSTSGSHTVAGIRTNTSSTTVQVITLNTIGSLSVTGSGSGAVTGLLFPLGGGTGSNIARNKIYDLSSVGAAAAVSGINISGGGTFPLNNNLIGDLRAPAATGLPAVNGIQVSGSTGANIYFNTIYLNASSTGATFGTSGIYLSSTTPVVDLRNNIVVNKSTAVGTGGITAALRRSAAATTGYASTSNNNLYYAGTPSATQVLYYDGTNGYQTLATFRTAVTPRESVSVTEDVPFLSTTGTAANFLHINPATPTQVESAGAPISGITVDFDGDTRNASTPDLGADEGTFTPQDLTGPSIAFAPLTGTSSTAPRTLTATITDPSGVSTTAAPRLYYRKGTTGAFVFVPASGSSGSTYTFTFDYSLVGGVAAGDVIQYYVAAQDALGNASTSPAGGTFTTNPSVVNQYTILTGLNGVYYVGTSASPDATRTYPTLTAAANAYSSNGMAGPVTFLLLDNTYSAATGETFPVIFFNNLEASATNTLLIKPNTGASPVITAAGSVLALAGSRYVTIDGSNTVGGTTRNLTLTSTVLTANTYGLGLLTQTGIAQSNLFATVRNVNVIGGGATTNSTFGILLSGADNDNVTLQNNSVQGVTIGIQAFGSANASAGGLDNLVIAGNVVGPSTASTNTVINQYGILVASAISPVIRGNEVQNIVNPTATFSSNMTGILLQDVKTGVVSRNSVHNLTYNGTSTAKLYGISSQLSSSSFNTAANPTAARFDNNLVYNLNSTATSSSWNTSGINNNGGYGDQYYFNTVYLSGQLSNGAAGSAAFSNGNGITSTAATNIDVRNNIFSIINGTGSSTTTPAYAHYTTLTSYTGSTLNNNDLYVTVGTNGVARIGRINGADATTLADWRTATGQEANSVSVNPNFAQTNTVPFDLTPTATALNSAADATTGVTVDFLGTTRSSTPDIGAYEFTPALIDVAATALVSPAGTGCYGATEALTVSFTNNSTSPLNLALNPVTVTVTMTPPGGTAQTFTTTVNSGTLAANTAQNVTLPGTLNLSAPGAYSFVVATSTTGDGTPGNDQITVTRTVVGVATQPQAVDFTGFTGSNLSAVFPGWSEAAGATQPAGTTSLWTSTSFPAGNTTAKINLFSNTRNEWIVSPKFLATNSTFLSFDAGLTDFASNAADPAGMTGTDDIVEVRISTDCGATFSRIPTFAQFNAANQPSNGSLTSYSINLSAYAGQQIILAFFASDGAVDDTPDYDFHIDNILVNSPLPIDLGPTALASPTATQGCYSASETVSVTVQNKGTQALNFTTNPATVTAVVTTPSGSRTLTATVSTGTLAPGATQNVALAPTLDMSATGAYTFAITANVQGDQLASNDVLASVTRTVAVPVAGTLSPLSASLCVSGTATLTLTGAANGAIQWQQSTDNVTFTDIAGATSATYTTPVLTSTTYYRAQVRCAAQATATTPVATVTVTNPLVASATPPAAICEGSTATLTATASAGSTVRFFATATGGTALATTTPGTYTTPALTANTTYYAEAVSSSSSVAGLADNSAANGTFTQSTATDYPLGFSVSKAGTLASVDVYPTATGTLTIRLYSVSGTQPSGTATAVAGTDVTTTITTAQVGTRVTIPLNYSLAPGEYKLSNFAGGLGRYSTYTGTYPLNSADGVLSVKGSYTFFTSTSYSNTTYNSFFNLTFVNECVGASRTAIPVTVTPLPTAMLAATAASCGTTAVQLGGAVGGSATGGTYTSSGTGTFSPNANTLAATYTPSAADVAAGSVTLTLTTSGSGACAPATAVQTLTLSAPAVATFSYPSATAYCAGSTGTVTPTLGTGSTAGTFSSTTGLTINATTGVIDLSTSTAGTYTVTNTIAASGACGAVTATATVTITPAASAAFAYSGASFCLTGTNPTPTVTGTTGGTFSSTTGLSLNATTGAINLSASTAGTYTVTYTVTGACGATSTATVTITSGQVATFSYGTGTTTPTFCVSGTTNPVATLGTGATAGTFTSTAGLTLNATTGAITLATSTPGTYTVTNTVAASGGCAATTATATVTITAAPVATFSYATTAGCVGSTASVTPTLGTGATAGTFSSTTGLSINATTGAINLATSTAGTYTVTNTVAASGGCAATTATATFTVNPRPATPTLSATYSGTTTTLTSSAATGNQFYLNNVLIAGATGQTYVVNGTPAQLGSYTVTTTNSFGCVSLPSAPLVVTAAKSSIAGASLKLYPNPTPNGEVTLELTGFRSTTQLTVLDPLGRVIATEVLPANAGTATHPLNLKGMASGVYLLRLSNADGVETRRLVME